MQQRKNASETEAFFSDSQWANLGSSIFLAANWSKHWLSTATGLRNTLFVILWPHAQITALNPYFALRLFLPDDNHYHIFINLWFPISFHISFAVSLSHHSIFHLTTVLLHSLQQLHCNTKGGTCETSLHNTYLGQNKNYSAKSKSYFGNFVNHIFHALKFVDCLCYLIDTECRILIIGTSIIMDTKVKI